MCETCAGMHDKSGLGSTPLMDKIVKEIGYESLSDLTKDGSSFPDDSDLVENKLRSSNRFFAFFQGLLGIGRPMSEEEKVKQKRYEEFQKMTLP